MHPQGKRPESLPGNSDDAIRVMLSQMEWDRMFQLMPIMDQVRSKRAQEITEPIATNNGSPLHFTAHFMPEVPGQVQIVYPRNAFELRTEISKAASRGYSLVNLLLRGRAMSNLEKSVVLRERGASADGPKTGSAQQPARKMGM